MKVLVAVKAVPDYSVPVRIKPDGSALDMADVRKVINPFDEIAVEEAVRLKEKGLVQEIIVVSIGSPASQDILRIALAMGADRGILVETQKDIEPRAAALILANFAKQESVQMCLLGKQAVDTDNNQTGQMLAGRLGWGQGTFASSITFNADGIEVTREIDGGLETIQLKLPAVITTDLRLNQPRYLSLPSIVQAKRKSVTVLSLDSLGLDVSNRQNLLSVALPKRQRAGVRVANVLELVEKLREARIIE